MSEMIDKLKNWLDKVYKEDIHVACLELPILKILSAANDFVSRDEIIKQLKPYGDFERGALSFDHLWSQRFGKGEEEKILNVLVEHDGQQAGDKKTKYKIKDNVRNELTQFIDNYNAEIEPLIKTRLEFVINAQSYLEDKFILWLNTEQQLSDNTCRNYNNRLKNKLPEKLEQIGVKDKKISLYDYEINDLEEINLLFQNNKFDLQEWNKTPTIGSEAWNALKYLIKFLQQDGGKMPQSSNPTQPLNQILYGPPGTGKTYHTINKALEIIFEKEKKGTKFNNFGDGFKKDFEITYEEALNLEDENFKRKILKRIFDLTYRQNGQIEFVTFHQSYGYEEFVEGIKAKTTDSGGIEYKIEAGIFKKLSKRATVNFEQAQENRVAKKDFDVIFKERVLDKVSADERLEIKMKKSSFYIKEIDESHIYFDKSGGDSQHVLLLKNLRAMYEVGENKLIIGGLSQYYNPLLEYLLENNEVSQQEKEPLKNYILIIDEINRGNISKIFGELITLIEESKRIGKEEALHIRLPYSPNENFGVPQNLYIIGTMNTADRSIALMDTALRRRFDFTEMMPALATLSNNDNKVEKYNSIERQENDLMVGEINIRLLLQKINQRIEYLYDRDHTIGHAYFMSLKDKKITNKKAELDNIFKNKIIPLLQEYFYDDWEKIRLVLGDNQKEKKEQTKELQFIKIKKDYDTNKLFGDSSYDLLDDEATKVYEINNNAFKNIESYKIIYE